MDSNQAAAAAAAVDEAGEGMVAGEEEVRFEDLTVDDDLPILDRILTYISSQVALQRLVHVKMLAEAAELAGYVTVEMGMRSVLAG